MRGTSLTLPSAPGRASGGGGPGDEPVFEIRDLKVWFGSGDDRSVAVAGVSYALRPGETLGVVGESGSGKSVTAMAALGLLPRSVDSTVEGEVLLQGRDLLAMPAAERRAALGKDIAMVFQDPISALNPVQRVGDQIAEMLLLHEDGLSRPDAARRAVELLQLVGVPRADVRARQYPHEFSGGMCQRAVIAMAIANRPKVLIADEPTTAVDVSVQAQILELLRVAAAETGAATVLISHDMGVIAEMADSICVMYGGRVVESGPAAEVLTSPRHPYTRGLLACIPRLDSPIGRLEPIPGQPPSGAEVATGCAFAPRCVVRNGRELCVAERPLLMLTGSDATRAAACHFTDEIGAAPAYRLPLRVVERASPEPVSPEPSPLLEVRNLVKRFVVGTNVIGRPNRILQAVQDVSFTIRPGETLGLVGESGCGKSTTARLIMRLDDPTSGSILFGGDDIGRLRGRALTRLRREMAMVFQDPKDSLNPRLTAGDNVAEPLRVAGRPHAERRARVAELFDQVGLRKDHIDRMSSELSGGQRQRVAIARALALHPKLLVMDEPVSALDVSVQAQILNLLDDLKKELGLAYLFVSHDLSVVRHVSDRVAVMYLGQIVETAPRDEIFGSPRHPYTSALLASVPAPQIAADGEKVRRAPLQGDPPSPVDPPPGCRFRSRCPLATEVCAELEPPLDPHGASGLEAVACHHAVDRDPLLVTGGAR